MSGKTLAIRGKIILVSCLLIGIVSVSLAAPAHAQMKVGYIRSDYVFSKYAPYVQSQDELETFYVKERETFEKMMQSFQQKVQTLQSQETMMTEDQKRAKYTELQQEEAGLQQYQQDHFGEEGLVAKKEAELLAPLLEEVNGILKGFAKEEGYDLLFDITTRGMLVYADEKFDVSELIVAKFGNKLVK